MTIVVNLIFLAVGCSVGFVAGRLLWPSPIDLTDLDLDPWLPESAPIPADIHLDDEVPPEIALAKSDRRVPRPITELAAKGRKPAVRAKRVRRGS